MRAHLGTALAILLAAAADTRTATANVWYVTTDGTGDAPTIQATVDLASFGDTVLVAAGTYTWAAQGGDHVGIPGPSMLNMRSGVTLRSESGPDVTILDAEGNGRVIRCEATTDVRIEGFTIQGGHAAHPEGTGPGPYSLGWGGAILCRYGSSIVIADNVIRYNRSRYNGGALGMILSDTAIHGNVICWNRGQFRGGGIDIAGGASEVRRNTIASNMGGGVGFVQATGTFSENLLLDTIDGNGLWCGDANIVVTCNEMWGNPFGNATTCTLGSGNISEDPLVCITSAEYDLQPNSLCLPENNSCGLLMGARGVGCTTTDLSGERPPRADIWVSASPNPFNPQTRITYALHPAVERVRLTIYDLRGRYVARLVDDLESGTTRSVLWNGEDELGRAVGAGIYLAGVEVGSDRAVTKLTLVR